VNPKRIYRLRTEDGLTHLPHFLLTRSAHQQCFGNSSITQNRHAEDTAGSQYMHVKVLL
jgi:hypothetical protein